MLPTYLPNNQKTDGTDATGWGENDGGGIGWF